MWQLVVKRSNNDANNNTAIGMFSMEANMSGYGNTAIGKSSLNQNTRRS